MNIPRALTGYDLVAKGISKNQAVLPELGLKDVYSTGSWLEEKQIQSAIESRKQLIEAERIEKSGVLSHAIWEQNLNLALVTQKSGGHWQYMGHNIKQNLYLYPEEALFLMEVNSLLLKYNDVKVSLQQAYSLLLRDKTSINQYKVYASLSRLGYKVFRHKETNTTLNESSQSCETQNTSNESTRSQSGDTEVSGTDIESNVIPKDLHSEQDCDMETTEISGNDTFEGSQNINDAHDSLNCGKTKSRKRVLNVYQYQIEKLKNRPCKPCDAKNLQKYFKNLPNFLQNQTVSISVPENVLIPDNITFNKSIYTINLRLITTKCSRPPSIEDRTSDDNVNSPQLRQVRSASGFNRNRNGSGFHSYNARFSHSQSHFRPFNIWHPFVRANYIQFDFSLQRPFVTNMFVPPRFQYIPRFQNINTFNYNHGHRSNVQSRKRSRLCSKRHHFETLKKLALRLKIIRQSGNAQAESLEALNKLIHTYNNRYKTRLRLSSTYEIREDPDTYQTIILNDEEEGPSKKPRLDEHYQTYTNNLNSVKLLASRLKNLERNNEATARHRRAFSSLIKTFNKSYKADIYMNRNFEVFDKSQITLDTSSSDSDCVVEETNCFTNKKLRNPFNIIKRLSEKRNKSIDEPGTSRDTVNILNEVPKSYKYSEKILKNFSKNWLPDVNDFGRAEIISRETLNNVTRPGNFIYEFMKFHPDVYENWLDLKVSFLNSLNETTEVFQSEIDSENNEQCKSIVAPEDCTNIVSILNKLSIIKPCEEAKETNLVINYDVYNRDVQNFRKTNPPKPHFRISCLDESSNFPSGEEIAALHAKYKDSVQIVFAIVGDGSISFIQINPSNLPMHISTTNTT
ncbi:uncharacterized protein Tsen54 [Battus philenor]|uniref:uncharacterized protein Tsen54 n=1 Tax=Battus philenor TaxID=42288 RepID=UPI0035CF1608